MNVLAEILSSRIRAEIFRLLFGVSNQSLHMREIERRSGLSIGTIQQELKKLLRLDLVRKYKDGNRLCYEANKEHPLYPDISNLVLKTIGLAEVIRNALRSNPTIKLAFVFGSIARHEEKGRSDVDLMVIGEIGLKKLAGLLSGISVQIGREINPHVFSMKEFSRRKAAKEHFLTQVLESPKIFIIGSEDELKAMA